MTDPASNESADSDTQLLIAALTHSWALYDARISRGLHVVNYFLVAVAVLANAYVSAINAKLYTVAAVIGISGTALTAVSFAVGLQQRRLATVGALAVTEIQDRIAARLDIESFRMAHRQGEPRKIPIPSLIAFGLAVALSISSALYALIR